MEHLSGIGHPGRLRYFAERFKFHARYSRETRRRRFEYQLCVAHDGSGDGEHQRKPGRRQDRREGSAAGVRRHNQQQCLLHRGIGSQCDAGASTHPIAGITSDYRQPIAERLDHRAIFYASVHGDGYGDRQYVG